MNAEEKFKIPGHIVFDHDGTLVNTDSSPYFLFTGMLDLLIDLKAQGFELYIWTARPRGSVLEITKNLEIASFFSDIFCSDDGLSKPHTMGLERLTRGVSKKNILHVGDSLTDINGAHDFGIEVVAACWNNPLQVNIYKAIADYTALDLNQCREIIKGKFYV